MRPLPAGRARWFIAIVLLGFAAILGRDFALQIQDDHRLRTEGRMRYLRTLPLSSQRGLILGRNGEPLAVNVPAVTIWADPRILGTERRHWQSLARTLHLTLAELAQRLRSGGADFAYLRRQVAPRLGRAVRALHLAGVGVSVSSRSYFPMGAITAPLVGFVDEDHRGAGGVEMAFNGWLAGQSGREQALLDPRGQVLQVARVERLARPGSPIRLSISPQIQYWAYVALRAAQKHFGAANGSAVVMNVRNGQILAMVSVPSCNPNNLASCRSSADFTDNAVHQAFEPGSVMKPFAIAAALASRSVPPTARFNVSHPLWIGGYPITDDVLQIGRAHV